MRGIVVAVSTNSSHSFSKSNRAKIKLLTGLGVEGDAHCGKTVQHRSRVAKNPTQPNLRQVHLIHAELHEELNKAGFNVSPGQMGENITTKGIDLLKLPTDTRLHIREVIIQITGLRNPCTQLDNFRSGLMAAVLDRDESGHLVRKAGVMGIVIAGGAIFTRDIIQVEFPPQPYRPLEKI